jgi:hypothetical protein
MTPRTILIAGILGFILAWMGGAQVVYSVLEWAIR